MPQLHISSEDLDSGFTYDGTFALNTSIIGRQTLIGHYIESGDIPWVYANCNTLIIKRTADNTIHTVTFATSEDDLEASVIALINAAFDATFLVGTATVYDAPTRTFQVTVNESITCQWTHPASNAKYVFGKQNTADETGLVFNLSARDIDARPKFMDVHIAQATSNSIGSRTSPGDLFISTFDEEVRGQTLSIANSVTLLEISFRRLNVPGGACPMSLRWDLLFQS